MKRKVLKNKPLVEAIFELRWDLQEPEPLVKIDPHYKLLVGRLYEKLSHEYPFHEQLLAATIPDVISGYIVQHRFRKGEGHWPLIQIGPGVMTVNDTEGYIWQEFRQRIIQAIDTLFEVYPDSKNTLTINRLLLRYIDAVTFNFEKDNVFTFLEEKLKTKMNLHQKIFHDTSVEKLPLSLDLRLSFACAEPKGSIGLRFFRGKRGDSDALVWETRVHATSEVILQGQNEITDWIDKAHNLTDDWFFELIEGELLRRFQ